MDPQTMNPEEVEEIRELGRLLSHLYLREITPDFITELDKIGVRDGLAELGLDLPAADDSEAIESLATRYFELFVNPQEIPPPIQSIVVGGSYEGDAAKGMRDIAKAAGVAFNAKAAGGAPVDHLGSQLAMYAGLLDRDQEAAAEFARRHLEWARPLLRHHEGSGFYGALATATLQYFDLVALS